MKFFKRNIALFSFKLVFFLSILGAIVIFFITPFVPDVGNDTRYLYSRNELRNRNNNEVYDVAFFGNSYSFTAYDPTILKSKLGLNTIHLNSGSQFIETSLIIAEEQLRKNDLKYVFFEVSGPSLRRPNKNFDEYWYYQTIALQELPFSINKLKYSLKYFPVKEFKEYYISSLHRNFGRLLRLNKRAGYKKVNELKTFKSHSEKVLFTNNGFIANKQKPISREQFEKDFYAPAYKNEKEVLWTPHIIDQTRDFIEYANSRGTQVIFIQSLKLYATKLDTKVIEGLKSDYDNVRFLDLNSERDEYNLDENSYYDKTHVNYAASYQVTNRLTDSLSQWFEIPIQTKNKIDFEIFELSNFVYNFDDGQDKFFRIEYDNLPPIELDGYKFVAGFYPKDISVLKTETKKITKKSEDHFFDLSKDYFAIGDKKIIVKRFESKITRANLDKIKMYFHKRGDTLKLPSYNISID